MTRHRKPPPPQAPAERTMKQLLAPPSIAKVKHATRSRRQLRGQVAMAQLAHEAERDRKRHLMPVATTPSTRPEAMTPVDETVRYVFGRQGARR
jgi:hypothetical protein